MSSKNLNTNKRQHQSLAKQNKTSKLQKESKTITELERSLDISWMNIALNVNVYFSFLLRSRASCCRKQNRLFRLDFVLFQFWCVCASKHNHSRALPSSWIWSGFFSAWMQFFVMNCTTIATILFLGFDPIFMFHMNLYLMRAPRMLRYDADGFE